MIPHRKVIKLILFTVLIVSIFRISPSLNYRYLDNNNSTIEVQAQISSPEAYNIAFSTFIGGSDFEQIRDVEVDTQGNIYVTGGTTSPDFPTTNGVFNQTFQGFMDTFVVKIDSNYNIVWSTLLGGPEYDRAYAIEVDDQGFVYIAGRAGNGFPTTSGVLQTSFGGTHNPGGAYGPQDGYITKLSPDGSSLVWSTYFGGGDNSFIRDIDVDNNGYVYIGMAGVQSGYPHPHITNGAFQTQLRGAADGVVAKLNPDAKSVSWDTYLGGSGDYDLPGPSIRVDSLGNVYIVGDTNSADMPCTNVRPCGASAVYDKVLEGSTDQYLAKFDPNGSFLWGTYLGGNGGEWVETHSLAVDSQDNPIIAATTKSTNLGQQFPINAFQRTYAGDNGERSNYNGDGFVMKVSSDGTSLLAGTYIGGSAGDGVEGIGVDAQDNINFSGATFSTDFPTTSNAYQSQKKNLEDMIAVKLSADLSQLLYSTYLGGSAVDQGRTAITAPNGNYYVSGRSSSSSDWPLVNPVQSTYGGGNADGALVMLQLSTQPTPTNTPPSSPTPTAPIPGDANNDGKVDGIDYIIWVNNYNQSTSNGQSDGDFNTDGTVDGIDYVIWVNNYSY